MFITYLYKSFYPGKTEAMITRFMVHDSCESGGIGRRTRLRIWHRKV